MFYKKVDLPLIPEEFLLEHNFLLEREVNDIGYGNIFFNKKEKLKSCKYSTYVIQNPNFLEWLVKNIDGVSYKSSIRLQQSYSEKNGTHIVHSDIDRLFALNYIFDTGGEKVTTNWYWEKNKPLFRTKPHGGTQSDTGYIDYKNLDSFRFCYNGKK